MKSNKHAGQFNLKGKKCLHLKCGCCEVINFKEEIETQRQKKEIQETIGVSSNGRTHDSDSCY